MLGRRGSLWFLAVPPYLWLLLLFVVPLGVVVAISLLPGSGRINFANEFRMAAFFIVDSRV